MLETLSVGDEYKNGLPALAPSQRLHLILLGVDNVLRSANFYDALGWQRAATSHPGFVKYDLGGFALCLISRKDLANDALSPGGTLVKPATKTHWGVAGYFRDPDGYLFEVDYEDTWQFDNQHHLVV
jgi:hypothetical protein